MKEEKLTSLEKQWILYDVGNSAFVLLVSTIIPIYFNSLAGSGGLSEVDYLAFWGYAASVSTLIVAVLGPVLGTLADTDGYKKKIFIFFLMTGVLGCGLLWLPGSWLSFLVLFVIAKVGYSASLIFYDSMLADVTAPERMDMVSSHGYAWGYIGSCIPFVISLGLVLGGGSFGLPMDTAMILVFLLNAGWWLAASAPLLKNYKQVHSAALKGSHPFADSFRRLGETFADLRKNKKILLFLISFFFYIDGVYTIIEMATAYGSAVGLDTAGLLMALLLTQVVAFPFALIFGKAAKKYDTGKLIRFCILAYAAIALFAVQLDKQWEFWMLAFCVGMFQGAVQALSRSYFAKIIPPEKAGEFFGIFDICGKGAAFIGTAMMGFFAQVTGSPNSGIMVLAVMFFIGFFIFNKADQVR